MNAIEASESVGFEVKEVHLIAKDKQMGMILAHGILLFETKDGVIGFNVADPEIVHGLVDWLGTYLDTIPRHVNVIKD